MRIAIIGGTGPQGQGLALRFARAGINVALGSRDGERSAGIAAELMAKAARRRRRNHRPRQRNRHRGGG